MKKLLFELSLTCVCLLIFILSDFTKLPLITTILSFYLMLLTSIMIMYKLSPTQNKLSDYITTKPEKNRIRFFMITLLNITLVFIALEPYILSKYKVHTPPFYMLNNNLGWTSVIIFTFAFLILPVYKLLKINKLKKVVIYIAKLLRKWHIPISLLGVGFVFMHVYFALISGFKLNYTYMSGYLALLDLLVLSVLGLLRFKKLDRKLHKYLSYIFILLTLLHYLFSQLRM